MKKAGKKMKFSKFKKAIKLFLLILLFSCSEDNSDYSDYETRVEYFENVNPGFYIEDSTLEVITWNIKLAFGHGKNPWSSNIGGEPAHLDSMIAFLLEEDPDLILFQEVPYNRENTIIKKVLDSIGKKMNYNFAFGAHGFNSNGAYPTRAQWGNAILTKFKINSIENREVFNLNDIWSRRSVLKANLEYKPGRFLDAFSLHFSTSVSSQEEFLKQVRRTRYFHEESNNPIILGGDFNASNSIDSAVGLINSSPPDYDDIDKIYLSENFEILSFYQNIERSIYLSDHFAGNVSLAIKD